MFYIQDVGQNILALQGNQSNPIKWFFFYTNLNEIIVTLKTELFWLLLKLEFNFFFLKDTVQIVVIDE
jgi:hypothetical protein